MINRISIEMIVRKRNIESRIVVDLKNRIVNVINCNMKEFRCLECVPFCEVIVAAKDYAYGRRKPKAEIFVENIPDADCQPSIIKPNSERSFDFPFH